MAVKEIVKQDQKFEFRLPSEKSVPTKNMETCILFGLPKSGKTTLLTKLPNCLIIDTENGSGKVEGLIEKVPDNLGPVGKFQWLEGYADFLIAQGKPYDYVAIDTFTEVNDWTEWSGTMRYMRSIQGKSFNRVDLKKDGEMLKPTDDNYMSVHTIPEGYGYRWSREDAVRIFDKLTKCAKKCVFFVCHVEDKYIGQKENVEVVAPKQLSLTGKLKHILPRKVDGIGYVYNEEGITKVNFVGNEDKVGGNRCEHLRGYNGPADWNKIFI
jgi:hypothetical protein